MNRVILIKYGELTTKKGNRNFFINTLYQNIQKKLKNFEVKISKDISRMYIEFNDKDLDLILEKMNQVFGIHAFQVAVKVESLENLIKEAVLEIMRNKQFSTFKVETKRTNKNFPVKKCKFR